jgi:hypothetical protein
MYLLDTTVWIDLLRTNSLDPPQAFRAQQEHHRSFDHYGVRAAVWPRAPSSQASAPAREGTTSSLCHPRTLRRVFHRPPSAGDLREGPHSSETFRHSSWRLGHLYRDPGAGLGSHLGHKQHNGVRASAWVADRGLGMIPSCCRWGRCSRHLCISLASL